MSGDNLIALSFPGPGWMRASQPLSVASNSPLRLDADGTAWLIDGGAVDLFAVAAADGELIGQRHPLCSVPAGEVVFAMPPVAGVAIIAVGRLEVTARPLGAADMAAFSPENRAEMLDSWLRRMAAAVFGESHEGDIAAEAGSSLDVLAGQRLHAVRGVVWCRGAPGTLVAEASELAVTAPMPIAAGLTLRAVQNGAVEMAGSAAMDLRAVQTGLNLFHRAILGIVAERIEQAPVLARQRVERRQAVDSRTLNLALQELAATTGVAAEPAHLPVLSDPAALAFARVADHLGIALNTVPRFGLKGESLVRSLARANGIGFRSTLLRHDWWRQENGPLLAWRGEARDPVALIPVRGDRYRVWSPLDGQSQAVTEEVAAEIAPQAVMLYRPLPDRVNGLLALGRFATRGIGRDIGTIAAIGVMTGAVAAATPLATGFLLGSAVPRAEAGEVVAVMLGLAVAAIGGGVFELTRAIALLRLEGKLEAALQPGVMQRLLALPVNFFRRFGTGELMNRVLSIQTMRRLLAGSFLTSTLSALFATTSVVVILLISPLLALVSIGVVGLAAVLIGALVFGELRQERARVTIRGEEDGLLVQVLQGIVKLRVAAAEKRIFAVWASVFARQKRRFVAGRRYAAAAEIVAAVYPILALLVLFFAAERLFSPGQTGEERLSLGTFLVVNAAFGQLLAASVALARAVAGALDIVPLFGRLRPILETVPEARSDKSEAPPLSGRIELSHISFRYAAGTRPVLDDISLRIEPGALAAFVGPSGSGKSTLFRLLLGFETAETGDILFDGRSIGTLNTATLRQQIGVVLQHSRVTTGSIFDNITSGLPYSLDDAWAAARLAGIDAEIEAMPMGMHTLLMEGTSTLSGGQRQRLMIARALIGQPRIILFDEATSALDNRSQALVMRSLARLSATRIIVAHRLSTVEQADCIFVIDRGRLVEAGNYTELLAAGGPFSRLARRQIL